MLAWSAWVKLVISDAHPGLNLLLTTFLQEPHPQFGNDTTVERSNAEPASPTATIL